VIAQIRYLLLTGSRTRTPLIPLSITFFLTIGTFFYPQNAPGSTWGSTAVMCCALCAWLVGAVLAAEPRPQAEMAGVALGGRWTLEALLVLLVAPLLALPFIAYPLFLYAVGHTDIFKPPALAGDVVGAALVQVCCGILGGTVGVLYSPPRVTRRATAIGATLASLLLLIALGSLFGPIAAAQAITDAPRGSVDSGELVACAGCLIPAAAIFAAAVLWSRRT
jgi:hypothetical protein